MRLLFTLFIVLFDIVTLSAQNYSTYYGKYDVNVQSDIDVSGDVNVNKNITTIDYGALAQANAMKEQTLLETAKFMTEEHRLKMHEITLDPNKAMEYGSRTQYFVSKKARKALGWGNNGKGYVKYFYYRSPYSLFRITNSFSHLATPSFGRALVYENSSFNDINTIITINLPLAVQKIDPNVSLDIEKKLKYNNYSEGDVISIGNNTSAFLHKKDINRSRIGGCNGFCGTLIWEDDYEKVISDTYLALAVDADGIIYMYDISVIYKGDKDKITYEDLEGRRYYLRELVSNMIATCQLWYNVSGYE